MFSDIDTLHECDRQINGEADVVPYHIVYGTYYGTLPFPVVGRFLGIGGEN